MGCYYTLIIIFVLTVVVTLGVNKVEFIMHYLTQKSGSVNQIKIVHVTTAFLYTFVLKKLKKIICFPTFREFYCCYQTGMGCTSRETTMHSDVPDW